MGAAPAVDGLTARVEAGRVTGLVGPDGAGKTTLLRLFDGLLLPTEGTVTVCGFDTRTQLAPIREAVSYMPQRFGLYEDLTVAENLELHADLRAVIGEERRTTMARLLEFTGLAPFTSRLAGRLSGGMKQKLALMCTLLHRPQILFLDEPTNGVDPVSRRDFWAILYQLLKDGITIFMTTAYLDEAERCNRIGLMNKGRLIRCSTPEAMKAETGAATLEGAFIKTIHEVEGVARS